MKPPVRRYITNRFSSGLIALGCALLTFHLSYATPKDSRVPGGLAVIPLPTSDGEWHFNNQSVLTLQHQDQSLALVPLSLSTQPGLHKLCRKNKNACLSFKVFAKQYPEQHIKLKSNKHVNLSKEDLARHNKEKVRSKKAFQSRLKQPPALTFQWPAEGPLSSLFGLKRFYNEQPRNPHTGLDIAAPKGSLVKAPAGGTVVLTGHFFFNGKVVYLNHGDGLVSMFCHLDEISVAEGDQVSSGAPIGKVGSTGRATGPHLHWTLSLRNVRIDPLIWLEDPEANSPKQPELSHSKGPEG